MVTKSPFVANVRGVIQGKRNTLFIYHANEKKLRSPTGKLTDVEDFQVHGINVYYSGVTYRDRCPNRECLYCLDLQTRKTRRVLGPKLIIFAIEFIVTRWW